MPIAWRLSVTLLGLAHQKWRRSMPSVFSVMKRPNARAGTTRRSDPGADWTFDSNPTHVPNNLVRRNGRMSANASTYCCLLPSYVASKSR